MENKQIGDIIILLLYAKPGVNLTERYFTRQIMGIMFFWNTVSKRYLEPNTAAQKVTDAASCDSHKTSCTYETLTCSKFHNFRHKSNYPTPDFLYLLLVRRLAYCHSIKNIFFFLPAK